MERVNSELSEMVERADADALAAQASLEADKSSLARHTSALQAEVRTRAPACVRHCLCVPATDRSHG